MSDYRHGVIQMCIRHLHSEYMLMPIINVILSTTGEGWRKMTWEPVVGMKFEIGPFLGVALDFLITAFVLYIIFIKVIHPLWNYAKGQ